MGTKTTNSSISNSTEGTILISHREAQGGNRMSSSKSRRCKQLRMLSKMITLPK
jgi:hypothetical protein